MEEKRIDLSKSNGFRLGCLALILLPIGVGIVQRVTESPAERAARVAHEERLAVARAKQSAADAAAEAAAKAKREAERQFQRDRAEAVTVTQRWVKQRLKAPATADFAGVLDHQVIPAGKDQYVVSGYVDAQNSFGAKIRTRYVCKLKRVDEKGNWLLVDLVM